MSVIYHAPCALQEEPVFLNAEISAGDMPLCGFSTADGRFFPAQVLPCGTVCAIVTADEGEDVTMSPVYGNMNSIACLVEEAESRLTITIGEKPVAGYCWDTALYKPYFGPLTDDDGNMFTRLDFTAKEHPHHRSIFVAVGDVNGVDLWNEPADCGIIRTEKIENVISGAALASFTVTNLWTDHDEKPLLHETTRYTMYNQSQACRMLDMEITFTADCGKVEFGPTKEAGPLGIRMRDELRADKGTGVITNSRGGHGESECWSKEAEWCDYAGKIGEAFFGITAYDHADNERYPTTWHVRDYGLFAANNLHFKGGLTIEEGKTLTYKYRILLRRDEASMEELEKRYQRYLDGDR